jgi:hypothetical protein
MRVNDKAPDAQHPPVREMRETRTIDRIHIAAGNERYWVVLPEPDGKRWTLRQLDDATGVIGPAAFISPTDSTADGIRWASGITGVTGWHSLAEPAGAHIEESYRLVRELAYRQRSGRRLVLRVEPFEHDPRITLAVVYERWTATGLLSPVLSSHQIDADETVTDALRLVSKDFGLSPDGWKTITEGVEYEHE